MPKKIDDPLTRGLPAQILLLSYIQPRSGYNLGQVIYQVEKYPPTPKIYEWTKKLVKDGYLEKTKSGFLTKTDKILEAIEELLTNKGLPLKPKEKILLDRLLKSPKIRNVVDSERPIEMEKNDEKKNARGHFGEVNVLQMISNILSTLATSILIFRSKNEKLENPEVFQFDAVNKSKDFTPYQNIEGLELSLDKIVKEMMKLSPIKKGIQISSKEYMNLISSADNWANASLLINCLPSLLLKKLVYLDEESSWSVSIVHMIFESKNP